MRYLIAAWLAAQLASAPQTAFRTGIEVVRLDVSVIRGGVPVVGLTARDFALTDNGIAQDVESVTLEQLPLSVTLVLDVSQSGRPHAASVNRPGLTTLRSGIVRRSSRFLMR